MSADVNDTALATGQAPDIARVSVAEARALIDAQRGVLVDTRDRRLYDNAHAAGAISLPLSEITALQGRIRGDSVPPDRLLMLYCA